jgi:hypothetical protein
VSVIQEPWPRGARPSSHSPDGASVGGLLGSPRGQVARASKSGSLSGTRSWVIVACRPLLSRQGQRSFDSVRRLRVGCLLPRSLSSCCPRSRSSWVRKVVQEEACAGLACWC